MTSMSSDDLFVQRQYCTEEMIILQLRLPLKKYREIHLPPAPHTPTPYPVIGRSKLTHY